MALRTAVGHHGDMEQVLVVGFFVAVWVALAVACDRKGRRRWVAWAFAVPMVVLVVAVVGLEVSVVLARMSGIN